MSFENPETWWLVVRSSVLLIAFIAFAWALLASRRAATLNFLQLSSQHDQAVTLIQDLAEKLGKLSAQVHELSLPSPMVSRPAPVADTPQPVSVSPSGARGYEMAIRMARAGASVDEIVGSCGTTRSEARLLRRLHCAAEATAA
jgi:Protein of unknown function (DUF2802)